jgi:hypothetical protein
MSLPDLRLLRVLFFFCLWVIVIKDTYCCTSIFVIQEGDELFNCDIFYSLFAIYLQTLMEDMTRLLDIKFFM